MEMDHSSVCASINVVLWKCCDVYKRSRSRKGNTATGQGQHGSWPSIGEGECYEPLPTWEKLVLRFFVPWRAVHGLYRPGVQDSGQRDHGQEEGGSGGRALRVAKQEAESTSRRIRRGIFC